MERLIIGGDFKVWTYNNSYEEIYHHGIKGMKWGVRRNRKKDSGLNSAGKKKSNRQNNKNTKKSSKSRTKTSSLTKDFVNSFALATVSSVLTDWGFNHGNASKTAARVIGNSLKTVGRLTVSAYAASRGATDIRWYD